MSNNNGKKRDKTQTQASGAAKAEPTKSEAPAMYMIDAALARHVVLMMEQAVHSRPHGEVTKIIRALLTLSPVKASNGAGKATTDVAVPKAVKPLEAVKS
jgi:hypothetical protein